jgi:hypothetical protein
MPLSRLVMGFSIRVDWSAPIELQGEERNGAKIVMALNRFAATAVVREVIRSQRGVHDGAVSLN